MVKVRLLFILVCLLSAQALYAQKKPRKGKRDFLEIKAPPIHYVAPDTTNTLFNEHTQGKAPIPEAPGLTKNDSLENVQLKKELTIVSEDTSTIDEGYISLIEISEELKIDCVWVTLQEYYSIWDSRRVNPYNMDGEKFNDTIRLSLYDTLNNYNWAFPIRSTRVTSNFGMRRYRWHYGIDIGLNIGDTIVAAFDGIVRITQYDRNGYGYYVLLRHYNGLETLYGHLSSYSVKVGDVVRAGDVIGLGGNTGRSTGPHLHFEVRYQGNAVAPEEVFDFKNSSLLYDTLLITPESFSYLKEARKVIYHTIRRGDTLSGISRRYGVSINTLCRVNGISRNSILRIGQRLRVR